jgi:uncharacterized membrane protein (UPF0136 family)
VNAKILLLLIGILAGGIVGWFTKPPAVSVQLGPVNIEIASNQSVGAGGTELTSEQWYYLGMIAAVGGLIGLGLGVLIDRRRT